MVQIEPILKLRGNYYYLLLYECFDIILNMTSCVCVFINLNIHIYTFDIWTDHIYCMYISILPPVCICACALWEIIKIFLLMVYINRGHIRAQFAHPPHWYIKKKYIYNEM